MKKIHIISLGCPKNLVDSETVAGILSKNEYILCEKTEKADVIIVNTCAFINTARKESYSIINQISNSKSASQKLVVCGCLPQYEKSELLQKYPKIDAVLGSSDFCKIMDALVDTKKPIIKVGSPNFIISNEPKLFSTPKSYAYIKIADGCNNRCSYCIIPQLRGDFRSRQMEHILQDVRNAVQSGRSEIILIGQDITMYGIDIYKGFTLTKLLRRISRIDGLKWLRLLYTHPANVTSGLIDEIAENEKACKYIDIPIQHTDDFILQRMKRPPSKTIFSTVEKLRKKIPGITLRTTIMVGFPGETEKNFTKLLNDIRGIQFDWLGGFEYVAQKGTASYKMGGLVPPKVIKERLNEIMVAQQKITLLKNKKRIGQSFEILVDSKKHGHTEFQAPEIDGKVIFSSKQKIGSIKKMKVLEVKDVYDLSAV